MESGGFERIPERITVAIYGLPKDGRATLALEQVLLRLPGVSRAYINAATEMAYVEFDPAQITHPQLLRAIESLGLRAGELDVRSIGSALSRPARRRTASAAIEPEAASILSDPLTAGRPVFAPHAELDAQDPHPARLSLGCLAGYLPGKLPGKGVPRLRLLVGMIGLVAVLGALLWVSLVRQAVPENAFTVEIGASGFSPVAVVLPAGKPATLRVHNADLTSTYGHGTSHQFTIRELGINVELQPGQSSVINLEPLQPATYTYYCDLCCGAHNASNPMMQGALIVH